MVLSKALCGSVAGLYVIGANNTKRGRQERGAGFSYMAMAAHLDDSQRGIVRHDAVSFIAKVSEGHERMKGVGDAAYPVNPPPFIRSCPY
jgi:hypothetical protein